MSDLAFLNATRIQRLLTAGLSPTHYSSPIAEEADAICVRTLERGLYVIHTGSYRTVTLKTAPPLLIKEKQATVVLDVLKEAIKEIDRSESKTKVREVINFLEFAG